MCKRRSRKRRKGNRKKVNKRDKGEQMEADKKYETSQRKIHLKMFKERICETTKTDEGVQNIKKRKIEKAKKETRMPKEQQEEGY